MTAPDDATQVIPPADVDVTAFLPPAPDLLPSPEDIPPPDIHESWEDRYALLLGAGWDQFAYAKNTDPSWMIAAARLAGEIREGLASGLLGRSR